MKKRLLLFLVTILLLVPVYLFILWLIANNNSTGYPENVALYNSYLPAILRGRYTTSLLGTGLCALVILINSQGLVNAKPGMKIILWIEIGIAGALGFLNLFSIM